METEKTSNSKFISGSAWMTFGNVTSNLLGALYVIPWLNWLHPHDAVANSLFSKGYQWYALFLVISQAGIPGAISKQVAKYNALNEYSTSKKIFQHGALFMIGLGAFFSFIMFIMSPVLSAGDNRLIPIFRSLSVAVLIIPVMSLLRGFTQGFNDMRPSAVSLLIEQIFRIIFILGSTYLIIKVFNGSYVTAVVFSTFAAFIGAIFSLLYLLANIFSHKRKYHLNVNVNKSKLATTDLFIEIIKQSIPYIFTDSSITLFFLIDQYTFNKAMSLVGKYSKSKLDFFYALFAANANKLTTIVLSLAVAMAVSLTPLLSSMITKKEGKRIRIQIKKILEIFNFIIFPASLGVLAVATPLYTIFYRYDKLGILILQISAVACIVEAMFMVLCAIFQALYFNLKAIKYLFVGIILKMIFQFPFIYFFHEKGAIIATGIAIFITCILMYRELVHTFSLKTKYFTRRSIGLLISAIIMCIITGLTVNLIYLFINPQDRFLAVLILLVGIIIGICVYGFLVLKTNLARYVLGKKLYSQMKNYIPFL
ncbi:putative polysaccharide biosynthesis protein [Xylocopilactobacillus apis]|uniref:Transporter n=1 Tax=Xylocopilactobacillus apis TaxID=2932183 RepID=A0AAU9CR25_9LACO|nr:polysaccharide biosynthesis protein [Xylocopilactobacillus apis]BDR56384.1 transporter [Xylocopilactobacillus apis]